MGILDTSNRSSIFSGIAGLIWNIVYACTLCNIPGLRKSEAALALCNPPYQHASYDALAPVNKSRSLYRQVFILCLEYTPVVQSFCISADQATDSLPLRKGMRSGGPIRGRQPGYWQLRYRPHGKEANTARARNRRNQAST